MELIKALGAKYNHADLLMTIALFALIYFAWRSAQVDLTSFGEGVFTIFGGRGVQAAGKGWGSGQNQQP